MSFLQKKNLTRTAHKIKVFSPPALLPLVTAYSRVKLGFRSDLTCCGSTERKLNKKLLHKYCSLDSIAGWLEMHGLCFGDSTILSSTLVKLVGCDKGGTDTKSLEPINLALPHCVGKTSGEHTGSIWGAPGEHLESTWGAHCFLMKLALPHHRGSLKREKPFLLWAFSVIYGGKNKLHKISPLLNYSINETRCQAVQAGLELLIL